MAIVDISTAPRPTAPREVALPAAGLIRQVTLPKWLRTVTVTFKTVDKVTADSGWWAIDGQSDEAPLDKGKAAPIAGGAAFSFAVTSGRPTGLTTLYLSGDSGSGYAYLTLEESELS